jgi:hypothetical protein
MVRVGSLFSQLLKQIPRDTFHSLVRKFGAERYAKGFASWTHLRCKLEPSSPMSEEPAAVAIVIRDAWKVARYLGIDGGLSVSFDELQAQKLSLALLSALIEPMPPRLRLEFSLDGDISLEGKRVCAPMGAVVRLGRFSGAVPAAGVGSGHD